jgi:hypothetical protein
MYQFMFGLITARQLYSDAIPRVELRQRQKSSGSSAGKRSRISKSRDTFSSSMSFPMTITGKQKFRMREQTIEQLGLEQSA